MTISHVDQPQFVVETDRSPSSDIINLSKTDDDVNENEFYDEEDNTIISVSDAHADHTSEKTSEGIFVWFTLFVLQLASFCITGSCPRNII